MATTHLFKKTTTTICSPASADLTVCQRNQRQQVPECLDKCNYDPYCVNGDYQFWHDYQHEHFGKIFH